MSQGPLCPNLTQKFQKEVSQIANRTLPRPILLGGLSVNLNHLKTTIVTHGRLRVKCVNENKQITQSNIHNRASWN